VSSEFWRSGIRPLIPLTESEEVDEETKGLRRDSSETSLGERAIRWAFGEVRWGKSSST
jgi:hypothetical protein